MNLHPSSGINLAMRHYAGRLTFIKDCCSLGFQVAFQECQDDIETFDRESKVN